MRSQNENLLKWTLYAAAAAVCFFAQAAFLQRITLLGVIPFLYPAIAAVAASFEDAVSGTVFALVIGVFCDLLLPGPIPCFFTLIFPLVGLAASLIARSLLPAGLICSLAVSACAFALTDAFHCFLLWAGGHSVGSAGVLLAVREFLATAPFVLPMAWLFRAVFRRTHQDN